MSFLLLAAAVFLFFREAGRSDPRTWVIAVSFVLLCSAVVVGQW